MANKDLVSEEVLQELITKLEELVNNYCHNLEYFTEDEVESFFNASADEVTYYNGLINDTITSKNFLWSSKKISEELANAIIEANGYTDNMIKNIASIKLKYVDVLPTSNISEHTIYILKASDGTSKDTLNLYNSTDGWASLGDFSISLDDYYTKTEIDKKMDLKANADEVISNDKIVQTLSVDTNETTTILSTTGLQDELDKKIDKANIVNIIDKNSTDYQIPSAKAVFQSVSNGKELIASAITDKGIDTSKEDTFQTMADNIGQISGGGGLELDRIYSIFATHGIKTNKQEGTEVLYKIIEEVLISTATNINTIIFEDFTDTEVNHICDKELIEGSTSCDLVFEEPITGTEVGDFIEFEIINQADYVTEISFVEVN